MIKDAFRGYNEDSSVNVEVKDQAGGSYRATHCMVQLKDEELVGQYQNLKGLACEVQVCSLLAHVYNEIEHDLRYKPLAGQLSKAENDLLNALGNLMSGGDTVINQTLTAVEARQKQNQADFEDEYDFVARMRTLFSEAPSFGINAGQAFEVCIELGLTSPQAVKNALSWNTGTAQQGSQLAEQLAGIVNPNPDIQLKIDPESSDQLLVLLLSDPERVSTLKALYPAGRGIGRAEA